MNELRKTAANPGQCPACNGIGSTIILRNNDPHTPVDVSCVSCHATGWQTERQIIINKGVNASLLGAMA